VCSSFTVETTNAAGTQQVERKLILAIGHLAGLRMCFNHKFQDGARATGRVMNRKIAIDINLFQCLCLCLTEALNNVKDRSSLDDGNEEACLWIMTGT
jgi:hypothetical protein